MKIKRLFVKNLDLSNEEVHKEFHHRWKLGLMLFVFPFIMSFGVALFGGKHTYASVLVGIFNLTAFTYGFFIYRCPRCGDHPKSSRVGTTGILFFPKKCAKCKAPLLPDHPWGQD
jgi:hypothetical protein